MSKMITVASGFQYSVNIGYDLNSDDKLKNFIPTKSALELMEDVLLSTNPTSNERARVLVGAYGKGKSHIVLTILAMLMKRDLELFKKALIENAMGYDAKDDRLNGQPNQMNIQSMYSDIDLDANDMETEFQSSFFILPLLIFLLSFWIIPKTTTTKTGENKKEPRHHKITAVLSNSDSPL